ncbi:MAG: carboxymuconolactone decarboxylase family protein [Rhodovibrio sp.]|nr:carboxymuconolactone decarboxylase family protein [Rhodovibrio sp.]
MTFLPSRPSGTLMEAFQANPAAAEPLHRFAQAIMRGDGAFSPAQREAIAARVSAANGCGFCQDSHRIAAIELGMDAEELDTFVAAAPSAHPNAAFRPVLAYVDKLNSAPDRVHAGDVDAVLTAGWPESALETAALICGFFNLMNRWVEGTGIRNTSASATAAGRMVARQGYAAISDMLAREGARG